MTNTDIATIAAIDIASQLPREIQDLILQTVVLRYYKFYNFNEFELHLRNIFNFGPTDVLVPLILLINCSDPLLDYAVRLALPKLSFRGSDLMNSRFVQQFANFALSESTTRMYKFSTDTVELSPLVAKLMEFTFKQTQFHEGLHSPNLQAPVFEHCSTLILGVSTIEHLCGSAGLLTRSNKLKILMLSIDMLEDEAHLLNKFTNEIQNWFNVNSRNKTEKSLILNIKFVTSVLNSRPITRDLILANLSEIYTFLTSSKDLNLRFAIFLILDKVYEDIFNGINTLLTQWHETFIGSLKFYITSKSKEFYETPSFTQLIDTVSTSKIKEFHFHSGVYSNDFYFSIDSLFRYSVSTVVDLRLSDVSISNCQNMPSLKRLQLFRCKLIGHDVLNGISEFCDVLLLNGCKYDDNNGSITLPTTIGFLDINGDISDLPKFSNMGKLQRLRSVKAEITSFSGKARDEETVISWLERFVAKLPSTVESLFLMIPRQALKQNISANAMYHPEKLRFDNLTQLQVLYLLIESEPLSTIPFNFSNLPDSLQALTMVMPSLFSGRLPKSLQSIDIDIRACEKFMDMYAYETFADFWNQFIAPLENLLYFRAINKHTQTIDSSALNFPPHLQVFDITSSEPTDDDSEFSGGAPYLRFENRKVNNNSFFYFFRMK
ncbi:unnamed protein product [Ambrosiozyma monospora]|uniref:Unnamed protein product n=1 Tax=Ambrosiozyma monospora TaxID=43982 RepID=A0A9W7DGQ6_AMBMO|nr:unnamed protein product [Ambrosiozyma monospora]